MANYEKNDLEALIFLALQEDVSVGDITSEAIFRDEDNCEAVIVSKSKGIYCGNNVIQAVFDLLDPSVVIEFLAKDGEAVEKGREIVKITGSTISVLSGERTILNFIQRMSGISTKTSQFVEIVKGTDIKILDTRKTLPGFRVLDKYSVKMGGGTNHRVGLFDMIMIKDNHIKAAGSITEAVNLVKVRYQDKFRIEVETTNLDEVKEAVESNIDVIMLDNMDKEKMSDAIKIIDGKSEIEVSGNMDLQKIENIKDLNIDFISVGALTHSIEVFDLSMKFK